jgi:hypothetical protein
MKRGVYMSSTIHLHCVEMKCGLLVLGDFTQGSNIDLKGER